MIFQCFRRPPIVARLFAAALTLQLIAAAASAQDQSSRQREGLRENRPDRFALINARIVVSPTQALERGMIVIDGRQIVQVSETIDPPSDAQTIDLGGKTIYAALIDAYTEESVGDEASGGGASYWNSRIRPDLDLAQRVLIDSDKQKGFRAQGIGCRLVAPASGIIKGQSCLLLSLDGEANDCLLKTQIAQHGTLTIPFGGSRGADYPKSPMGATALARQTFYDARWYGEAWRIASGNSGVAPPEYNASLAALQPVLESRQPLVLDCGNESFAMRADRFAREFGVRLILRGSGREYERLEDVSRLQRPILLPVDFPKPPAVGAREGAVNASLDALMHWDIAPENPSRLAKAGVQFAFCSFPLKKPEEFLTNVRRAVHRGLDRNRALAALTTEPAEIFGTQSLLGTIERGKLANLVVANGDLFDKETKIIETWVAGKRFVSGPIDLAKVTDQWLLKIAGVSTQKPMRLVVESTDDGFKADVKPVDDEDEKAKEGDPKPKDEREPKDADDKPESSVRNFVVQGNRLSGSVDGRNFGLDGWLQFTLVVVGKEATGLAVFPDGKTTAISASRIEKPTAAKEKPSDETAERKADAQAIEVADQKASQEKSKTDSKPQPEKDLPATYSVNYPLGAYGVASPPNQPRLVVFRGATIWTCGPQGVLENASLVVGNGKVIGVFASGQPLPKDAEVVDATGRHITPGIIDCHSHMATDGGVNESGQAITAEVRIGDFIDCHDITIYRQLAGGVTAANILHGSANPIGGQNQVIKLRWGANEEQMKFAEAPQGIKFALGENVKQSNRGDAFSTRYPQTRMGVEQIIDDEFRAARDYRRRQEEWKATAQGLPPRTDLELEAIAEILEGKRWVHCHSYRQDEILALLRVLDQHGVRIGSFQHILEGYKVAEKMAEHGATASAFADWWAYKFEVYDAIPHAGALMHQAGIVVSFNSDDAELGRHLNHEAAKAVRYGGVEPAEALKFVTLNPAKQLRIDQFTGSLEPEKHADFVVWNGPPLSNFSRPLQTWVDGRKYFDLDEDQKRQAEVAAMHQKLVQKVLASGQEPASDEDHALDDSRFWPRFDEFCHGHDHDDQAHTEVGQ